ncbi:hypothetical protein SAMN05192566_0735 [Methylophilus rhizosphaerae]|uniref:Uncharacterized protein n=1 Tax=Methylophilus rhizosphaerae TaxID=492660 RepID=A0A1G9A9V3_9PROT|nr:hypothetical protein [Methylophilus rhizosphaerae]SDK23385.1 hypothetical protein SAMN05192566_0735 [Methylophilus rhizosphaerae]
MKTPIEFNPLMTTIKEWKAYATHLRCELTKAQMVNKIKVEESNSVLSIQIDVKDTDGFTFQSNLSNDDNNLLARLNSEICDSLSYYIKSKIITLENVYHKPRNKYFSFRANDTSFYLAINKKSKKQNELMAA